ncbi:SDR family oxidoreductase [Acuticoccus sp. M5D2P5]|uniref:SDR family NAD(P)-dependent oxidoreductase n=1 Tax=Acuticoccus kalidii TaxID=2910977 RepID=UPI001F488D55|nr:SDR family oxidoreductase [Acuticoccus kalidii]MCF3933218.1 SDR family oxidoreductase [Acuticoccus kalidii]
MPDANAPLLANRRALVTGGARGLGAAIAARFAAAGAVGAVLDREAGAAPPGWLALDADVAEPARLAEVIDAAAERLGGLDIVVANAGIVPPWRRIEALDFAEWDRAFAINVRGVAATLKAAVPHMRARGGSIILMASLNGRRAHPRQAAYSATKHAVIGLMRAAAADLGAYGIRVNTLSPGPVATDALRGRVEARAEAGGTSAAAAFAAMGAEAALGRIATEEEVAGAALFLASDLSAGITGTDIPIDAGLA